MTTRHRRPSTHDGTATSTRAIAIALLAGCAACGSGTGLEPPIIDRDAAPHDEAENLTLEEAGLLASGELIDIYGLAADPVPASIDSQIVEHQGQQTWMLDVTVDVTDDDGQRIRHQWRMWIGTPTDGPPDVLRAQRHR